MIGKRRFGQLFTVLTGVGCACVLAVAAWFWANPTQHRITVILIGSQHQADPAANAYVRAAPDHEQIAKLLISNASLDQLTIPALKPNPHLWLQDHLHVRSIQGDRIEIIASARTYEAAPADMDDLIALATEVLIADATRNGLNAEAISLMRSGG